MVDKHGEREQRHMGHPVRAPHAAAIARAPEGHEQQDERHADEQVPILSEVGHAGARSAKLPRNPSSARDTSLRSVTRVRSVTASG